MKIGEEIILNIENYGISGEGVAKIDNFTIFVPFAMKGEVVKIKIEKMRQNIAFARVVEIIKKSAQRQIPPCENFGKCGGCAMMHIPYEIQLEIKKNNVQKTLQKNFKNVKINSVIGCENKYNYRNKIEFVVLNNHICFYEKNTHNKLKINNCLLFNNVNKLIEVLNIYLQKINNKNIYQIIVREIENSIVIVFSGNITKLNNIDFLINLLNKYYKNISIYICQNKKIHNENLNNNLKLIYGKNIELNNNNISCEISANSFLQINNEIEKKLYDLVLHNIENNSVVINAFSGAGFLTALISQKAKKVFGVEIVENAHKNANNLVNKNNIKNVQNICGDCTIEIPKLVEMLKGENLTIVLDPARSGASAEVMQAINLSNANKVIYISCNPATLSRDLTRLFNYEITFAQPFDMFPQTAHIETLVLLSKRAEE